MPALNRIHVAGYKSIRELDLELAPLNIMIGANGAGKSNLIGVFRLLRDLVAGNLQLHVGRAGGASVLLHHGPSVTDHLDISLEFLGAEAGTLNTYRCSLEPTADDGFVFVEEVASFHNTTRFVHPLPYALGSGHRETALRREVPQRASAIVHYVSSAMQSWRVYHFHDTSDSAPVKATGDLGDNHFLRPDAANLAAYLYWLQKAKPEHYRNIVDTIRLIAPFFDDFDLHPDRLNQDKIRLEWREVGSDAYFNAGSLSDGTLRFICLAVLLLQPRGKLPSTILLDEPELGLHPYALTVLAGLLRAASQHTQLLISTQSVTLVNQFEPDELLVVERDGRESIFRRLNFPELAAWMDDYALGELWEKNIIGGRPTR